MRFFGITALAVGTIFVAACSSQQPKPEEASTRMDGSMQPQSRSQTANTPAAPSNNVAGESEAARLARLKRELANRSIYFDFDDSAVKAEFNGVVAEQTKFMAASKNTSVRIEGNTDERGSAEYNLALGQRRAEAVRKMLELNGINAKRIETVSFGKEKLRLVCHEEKCWHEDRRADFSYN